MLPIRSLRVALACALLAGPAAAVDRLDPRDFDTKIAACTDLYQFANGGWLKASPVAPGRERNNRFGALEQHVQEQRQALARAIRAQPGDPLDTPLAALMQSTLDEAALAPAREQALQALLAAIPQATRGEQVLELIAGLQSRGLPLLFSVQPRGEGRLALQADVLTLPDPAFYLSTEPAARDWLGRYRGYVETLLTQAGSSDVATESAWVLDFEAKLAQALQTPTADPDPLSLRQLGKRHRHLQWKALLKPLGLDDFDQYELRGDASFAALDGLLASAHPVQWRAWLRFRVAHLLAPYLDAPFRDAHDRFIRVALRGEAVPEPELRAQQLAERLLGDAFAQRYADTYFGPGKRAQVEALIASLRSQLGQAIDANQRWQPDTREAAQAKLDALNISFVLPGERPDLSALRLNPANLVGNVLAISRWRLDTIARGKSAAAPVAEPLRPQLNYQHEHNRLVLSPALLQAPLYDEGADAALLHGGLGALLAHELSHGFDLGGASFDGEGRPRPWWEEADRAAYLQASQALVAQYGAYPAVGDSRVDGARTLAENAADLNGLWLSWQAFAAHHDLALPKRDGLSPAQRFFVAWASLWRENALDGARQRDAAESDQAPAAVRAIGPLPHLPAFAQAFSCKPGSRMLASAGGSMVPWP